MRNIELHERILEITEMMVKLDQIAQELPEAVRANRAMVELMTVQAQIAGEIVEEAEA